MKNFEFLDEKALTKLFYKEPEEFNSDSPRELLAVALGATIYTPGNRPNLTQDILKMRKNGSTSVIICLEDSIPDDQLEASVINVHNALKELSTYDKDELPLIFIRPAGTENLRLIAELYVGYLHLVTGFSLPKFDSSTQKRYMTHIHRMSVALGKTIYAMPIIESPDVVFAETRQKELTSMYEMLTHRSYSVSERTFQHVQIRDYILNIRIGATDMASPFGLRRSRDLSVYDVKVVADAIGSIVNVFGRAEDDYVISGPVWEHFTDRERLFKPELRQTPFAETQSLKFRKKLIMDDLDGLIREVELDRANGIWGKTVIHPHHVSVVNSMMVVSHEEYMDALDILKEGNDGAIRSHYRNKMNETKPHSNWAKKVLMRAKAFGVANAGINFADFMEASIK